MADADSILASVERVHRAVLAIEMVCSAAYGECGRPGDLATELAFGVQVMAEQAIERIELVKQLLREGRDAC